MSRNTGERWSSVIEYGVDPCLIAHTLATAIKMIGEQSKTSQKYVHADRSRTKPTGYPSEQRIVQQPFEVAGMIFRKSSNHKCLGSLITNAFDIFFVLHLLAWNAR